MSGARSLIRSVGFFVVLTALLGLAACGDDDEEEAGGDVAAFCDAYIAMVQASDSEEELTTLAEEAETLLDKVQANTPNEVSEPVGVVVAATRQAAAEGTPKAFQSREVDDAFNEVISYMFDNCESAEKLDVTAVEYAFKGVPDTLSAGLVALRFTNDGDEYHEFIVFRKNDGVTESFDEILELPEGQSKELMTFVGAANAEPGESRMTVFEAKAGEHIAVCFIPVGTTVEGPPEEGEGPPEEGEGPPEEGEGPPHWVEGQRSEFTVE